MFRCFSESKSGYQNCRMFVSIYILFFILHRITLNIEDKKETNVEPEPTPPEEPPQNLPVLEPGDQLLMNSNGASEDMSKSDTHEVQKRNVFNKITDRGKDFISILYPPYEEERIEKKLDDSERKKAEKYALSTVEVLRTDVLREAKVSQPTPLAQVVEGRVITAATLEVMEGIEGNSKLWIGKDYTNFIVKDFSYLDLPFVGK